MKVGKRAATFKAKLATMLGGLFKPPFSFIEAQSLGVLLSPAVLICLERVAKECGLTCPLGC